MILQLTNRIGRVVFQAVKDELGIKYDHECGLGWCNKPEEFFMSAACCLADNPSCKITGQYTEQFKAYCNNIAWLKVKFA